MSRKFLVLAVLGAALAVPAAAAAGPSVFGTAKDGPMHATSSVLVFPKAVALMGGWENTSFSCNTGRRLEVMGDIYRTRHGHTRHIHLVKRKVRANCAEGGPNTGFSVVAANRNLACPDGRWKPGWYEFRTRTTILSSGLQSDVSLGWRKAKAC